MYVGEVCMLAVLLLCGTGARRAASHYNMLRVDMPRPALLVGVCQRGVDADEF